MARFALPALLFVLRPVRRRRSFLALVRKPRKLALIFQRFGRLNRLSTTGLFACLFRIQLEGGRLIALDRKELLGAFQIRLQVRFGVTLFATQRLGAPAHFFRPAAAFAPCRCLCRYCSCASLLPVQASRSGEQIASISSGDQFDA